ncbi:MAG: hypothetical protein SGI89_00420 [bacterium]|nr:hypothetical protein [bacterium]
MLTFVVIYYTVVALLGLYLFIKFFSKTRAKLVTGIVHGALGLLGLGILIIYISFQKAETPIESFLLLLMAFFFGAGMFVATLTEKKFPKIILFLHVAFALSGVYFLYKFWLG